MPPYCDHGNHVWTVETRTHQLTPALDLVPGRRCLCGLFLIIDADPLNTPGDSLTTTSIDSIAAAAWASFHPALKTW